MNSIIVNNDELPIHTTVYNPDNKKKSMILVPGLGRSGKYYQSLAKYLSSEYRVITYDPRSHGENNQHYDYRGMSEDLTAIINNFANDSQQLKVIGYSNGVYTAIFAATNPKISNLVLVSLPYSLTDLHSVKMMIKLNVHNTPHKKLKLLTDTIGLITIPYLLFKDKLHDSFYYQNLYNLEKPIKIGDLYISDWNKHAMNIINAPCISEVASKINIPTKFIFGSKDNILHINSKKKHPLPKKYDEFFSKFNDYQLFLIPEANHSFKIKKTHNKAYTQWPEQTKILADLILK